MIKDADTYYFHKDHLKSSTVVTDYTGEEANVAQKTEYLPFRMDRSNTGNVTDYKFTDQELDGTTDPGLYGSSGLYNYDARMYDPVIGLFVMADSVVPDYTDPQSLNRYSYCRNNPLIYVDPSGHQSIPSEEEILYLMREGDEWDIPDVSEVPEVRTGAALRCHLEHYNVHLGISWPRGGFPGIGAGEVHGSGDAMGYDDEGNFAISIKPLGSSSAKTYNSGMIQMQAQTHSYKNLPTWTEWYEWYGGSNESIAKALAIIDITTGTIEMSVAAGMEIVAFGSYFLGPPAWATVSPLMAALGISTGFDAYGRIMTGAEKLESLK